MHTHRNTDFTMPANSPGEPARYDRNRNFRPRPNSHDGPRSASTPASTGVHRSPWQSTTALQLGLQPRSFSELHTERVYLLEMLQQHDQRAIELFRLLPQLEEQIRWPDCPDEQRQARKHRGWVRHRIADIVEKEREILTRLSELHVEIQCCERWHQVAREREVRNNERQQQQQQQPQVFPSGYVYIQPGPAPVPPYPEMNPSAPIFDPQQHHRLSTIQELDHESSREPYQAPACLPDDNRNGAPAELLGSNNNTFEVDGTGVGGSTSDDSPLKRRSKSLESVAGPKLKKPTSMPTLHCD
ncbi:hypothetical protein AAE478_001804 [Parahypoxylon ruwenzoriense]